MKLDNDREIINFRNGCIQDLKRTLKEGYNIEIEELRLEDFINESGVPLLDSIKRVGIDSYQVTNWQDYITELQNKSK